MWLKDGDRRKHGSMKERITVLLMRIIIQTGERQLS